MKCMICNQPTTLALDLGSTPLANRFLLPEQIDQDEPTYPLRLGRCGQCHHVQLLDPVPPSAMFDEYLYVSGYSETLTDHLKSVASMLSDRFSLQTDDLVIDIGANDGTLLSGFDASLRRVGVEPAQNLHELAAAKGIQIYPGYFGPESAEEISYQYGRASVITSTNSFPHIPDVRDFFDGIHRLLAANGVLMIEAHYLMDMYEQLAFDTIYHEHVSYWHLGPLLRLLDQFGLEVFDCERLPIHHGQLRVFIQFRGQRPVSGRVSEQLQAEHEANLDSAKSAEEFARQIVSLRDDLQQALAELKQTGKRVVGYGAPAKGNTLIHYLGLSAAELPYIADRSELKQGRVTPGSHIPIVSPDDLIKDNPDCVLILAWNFADEIVEQLRVLSEAGTQFVVPVPKFKVLEAALESH